MTLSKLINKVKTECVVMKLPGENEQIEISADDDLPF
jgi:hypothetical protein